MFKRVWEWLQKPYTREAREGRKMFSRLQTALVLGWSPSRTQIPPATTTDRGVSLSDSESWFQDRTRIAWQSQQWYARLSERYARTLVARTESWDKNVSNNIVEHKKIQNVYGLLPSNGHTILTAQPLFCTPPVAPRRKDHPLTNAAFTFRVN